MAKRLLGFAKDEGVPPQVALKATTEALDRAGVTAKTGVEVEVTVKKYEKLLGGITIDGLVYKDESPEPETPALERGTEPADPNAPLDVEVVEMTPERPRDVRTGSGQGNGREPTEQPYVPQHITGEEAYRQAARANRAAGVWPARRR